MLRWRIRPIAVQRCVAYLMWCPRNWPAGATVEDVNLYLQSEHDASEHLDQGDQIDVDRYGHTILDRVQTTRGDEAYRRLQRQKAPCVRPRDRRHSGRGSGSGANPSDFAIGDDVTPPWFRPRGYMHVDAPVGEDFVKQVIDPDFVAQHPFSPLIHYEKVEKRYKKTGEPPDPKHRKIDEKKRSIRYASHRDACILAYYSWQLVQCLDNFYTDHDLQDNVIAYRGLGKANYDFASDALEFAKTHSPVVILALDVTGFFDNLDHGLVKSRLKGLLGVEELPPEWYQVYRAVTRHHSIELSDLGAHPVFGERLRKREPRPVATISEIKSAGIAISPNPTPGKGIPQGTPISAVLSNLYMIDFDRAARSLCAGIGAFYRRYSDDILVICTPNHAPNVEAELGRLIAAEKLEISPAKTERTLFDMAHPHRRRGKSAQYLGFNLTETGPSIRESSLSRRWRRMRWSMKAARAKALNEVSRGRADRLWTKSLRERFTAQRGMNFGSYGRRSASAFADERVILRQLRRLERAAEQEMDAIQKEVDDRLSRIRIIRPSTPSA